MDWIVITFDNPIFYLSFISKADNNFMKLSFVGPENHVIPDFSFVNQNNEIITNDDYRGNIYVANFSSLHVPQYVQ